MKWLNEKKAVTVYVASGWFNEEQEKARKEIIEILEKIGISYFSPKDEVELKINASKEERKNVFKMDVESIKDCDFMIASTVGKDMGTMMEMGMAYAWDIPFIVYFPNENRMPCNVMLAESSVAVAQSYDELYNTIMKYKENNYNFKEKIEYEGGIQ